MVTAQDSYWGWKLSDSSLTREFLLLSEGYGCKPGQCVGIDSCGGNRNSVLCGGCIPGYSAAFFTTDCVADGECSAWKLWLLIFMALLYAVLYTIFLRYSPETLTVENPNLASAPSCSSLAQEPSAEIRREGRLSSSFQVLMWYYQLVGLLLAMPNPLKFFDGQAVILNIIGLIFGTAPASQVFELPSLVFCTKAGSTTLGFSGPLADSAVFPSEVKDYVWLNFSDSGEQLADYGFVCGDNVLAMVDRL